MPIREPLQQRAAIPRSPANGTAASRQRGTFGVAGVVVPNAIAERLQGNQSATSTMRYDRARVSLDRHATYIVSTFIADASR